MGLKIILTGATGMVGEGVLRICLQHPHVEKVLVITRKSSRIEHAKLKEIIHANFQDLSSLEEDLTGFDTCFFCLGISSVGINADAYYETTYKLTMHFAETISKLNKDMTFCYVSGAGTDSSEKGPIAWARVKGKTENDLARLPFKKVFGLRPGFIKPLPKQKNALSFYKYIFWLFPIGRYLSPNNFCSMEELALSMISLAKNGFHKLVINGRDIIELAKHQSR